MLIKTKNIWKHLLLVMLMTLICSPTILTITPIATKEFRPTKSESSIYLGQILKENLQINGRQATGMDNIQMDSPNSGFRFKAHVEGDIKVKLRINFTGGYNHLYFTCFINGKRTGAGRGNSIEVINTNKEDNIYEVLIAKNLTPGDYEIEFFRQNEAVFGQIEVLSLEMQGGFLPYPRIPSIEFIGDSITSGYGVYPQKPQFTSLDPYNQDATRGYAFLAAHDLNLQISTLSVSGWGLVVGWGENNNLPKIYPYTNWFRDHSPKGLYPFQKPFDIVCINLGTNDWNQLGTPESTETKQSINSQIFYEGIVNFTNTIRSQNPNAVIVWLYGMMMDGNVFSMQFDQAVNYLGGEDNKLYAFKISGGYGGLMGHPSLEEQEKAGQDLTKILASIINKHQLKVEEPIVTNTSNPNPNYNNLNNQNIQPQMSDTLISTNIQVTNATSNSANDTEVLSIGAILNNTTIFIIVLVITIIALLIGVIYLICFHK